MKPAARAVLGLALAATLMAAYFAPSGDGDAVALSDRSRATSSRAPTPSPAPAGATAAARGGKTVEGVQVLAIRARDADADPEAPWLAAAERAQPVALVAAPVAAVAASEAVQAAPPLPFRPFGRYLDGAEEVIFLQHNDQSLAVRVGDTIAHNYKVERLEGGRLTLRYLPLDQTQTLELGSAEQK